MKVTPKDLRNSIIFLLVLVTFLLGVFFTRMKIDVAKLYRESCTDRTAKGIGKFPRNGSSEMEDFFHPSRLEFRNNVKDSFRYFKTLSNMREIMQAIRAYELDTGKPLPKAVTDGEGNELLSWRVLLLPYLGEEEFYKNIRLDEPWYSVHNRENLYAVSYAYASRDPNGKSFDSVSGDRDDQEECPAKEDIQGSKNPRRTVWRSGDCPPSYCSDFANRWTDRNISAVRLPEGREGWVLVEGYWRTKMDPITDYSDYDDLYPDDTEEERAEREERRFIRNNHGCYMDPEGDFTIEDIRNGSFLKRMKERYHKWRLFFQDEPRFLLCCEQGEYLISIDVDPDKLADFILEKCCKN